MFFLYDTFFYQTRFISWIFLQPTHTQRKRKRNRTKRRKNIKLIFCAVPKVEQKKVFQQTTPPSSLPFFLSYTPPSPKYRPLLFLQKKNDNDDDDNQHLKAPYKYSSPINRASLELEHEQDTNTKIPPSAMKRKRRKERARGNSEIYTKGEEKEK